jgi:hypothetical protein
MSILLRVAAVYLLLWAIGLALPGALLDTVVPPGPVGRSLAVGLAISYLGFAILLWYAARDPGRSPIILYAALLVFGLRAIIGTYEVLKTLEGRAAEFRVVDMVLCLAAFVGILNLLPGTIQQRGGGAAR